MTASMECGALVVSLDFELHWGVRDHTPLDGRERKRLLEARKVLPGILSAFSEHNVRATWAAVGLLFARSRDEAEECRPLYLPNYERAELSPYKEPLGRDESDDPFHFAPSLIHELARHPGQELASHSFSHFYSLEAGQGDVDFTADLTSAKCIAENSGYRLRSYVFPRNQVRRRYLEILRESGFDTYRGTEPVAAKAPVTFRKQRRPWHRALRLVDSYWNLNGPQTVPWELRGEKPVAVNASRYLRPYSSLLRGLESARLKRVADSMGRAARANRIFHLWWHPEDFAGHPARNLDFLNKVLTVFDRHRREYGMASLSMGDVSDVVNLRANGNAELGRTTAGSAR